MKEQNVKNLARDYLKKVKKCIVREKSNGKPKEFQWELEELKKRTNQKLDVVGISKKGKIYVVECKAGLINRPLRGAGQLLRYRVLIERNFEKFRENLEDWSKRDRKSENRKESEVRISKNDESKLRYYLAVPKYREKEWNEILEECCRYLGFKREKEYRNILVFRYKGYKF